MRALSSFLCVVLMCGCGAQEHSAEYAVVEDRALESPAGEQVLQTEAAGESKATSAGDASTAAIQRKIIYVAEVQLVVEDFATAEQRIPQLVAEHGGCLADMDVHRTQDRARSGRWVARIPVERFDAFVTSLDDIGVPVHRDQSAQDVTAEYIDLEARIANKKRLEERLLQLLEDRSGKLSEVIEVEHQLARVREEIETMQGRLRYLANRAELASVTISVREEDRFVPAQAPTFPERIADAWADSLASLRRVGEAVVIAAVAAAPWLILAVPVVLWYVFRRRHRAVLAPRNG